MAVCKPVCLALYLAIKYVKNKKSLVGGIIAFFEMLTVGSLFPFDFAIHVSQLTDMFLK